MSTKTKSPLPTGEQVAMFDTTEDLTPALEASIRKHPAGSKLGKAEREAAKAEREAAKAKADADKVEDKAATYAANLDRSIRFAAARLETAYANLYRLLLQAEAEDKATGEPIFRRFRTARGAKFNDLGAYVAAVCKDEMKSLHASVRTPLIGLLSDFNVRQVDIAEITGVAQSHVSRTLAAKRRTQPTPKAERQPKTFADQVNNLGKRISKANLSAADLIAVEAALLAQAAVVRGLINAAAVAA